MTQQSDVTSDKATGLNTYVSLTDNPKPALIRNVPGMYAIAGGLSGEGAESVGWELSDEVDMTYGPGWDGACQSQHLLRDSCGAANKPAVVQTNQRITALAPVLNSQSYQWTANPSMDTMLKAYNGSYYLFAMPGPNGGTGTQR